MSGRRASSGIAAATKPRWSRPREREATRLAILDAAHRLIELHGEAALNLSDVANEAGIARATIYGYFSSRRQLIGLLTGETTPEPEPAPASSHEEALAPVLIAPSEAIPTPASSGPDLPVQADERPPRDDKKTAAGVETANASPSAPENAAAYNDLMRRQAEELDRLAKRVIVPKSMMKEGTDGAISRLETRLHVAEQSVAEVETRRGRDAKELAERIDLASEAVQQLQKRLETSDNRQQLALAQLRLDFLNLASRVADTGRGPHDTAPDAVVHSEPVDGTVSQAADFQPWKNSPMSERAEPGKVLGKGEQHAYLSSARRAAIDASQQTDATESARTGRWWTHWRWLLGAAIAAAAVLGLALNMHSDIAAHSSAVSEHAAHDTRQATNSQREKRSVIALAKAGNAEAQLLLGLKLLNGTGVAMNIETAAGWLERAANGGQPVAQEIIGVLYQTGTGVATDMPKAIRWYETAALLGNVKAMADLGKVYAGGWSEGTDFAKATQWLARAAGFGDVDAQFDLAILYERGQGVPISLADAYKWYAIAAAQGDRDAATQASIVAAQLSPDELWAAKKAAADFKPNPVARAANDTPSRAALLARRG
ncbi:MAG: TetR family transcriptional regulator [Rhizomicrobium sp.]